MADMASHVPTMQNSHCAVGATFGRPCFAMNAGVATTHS